jgi:autotransporter translocation and assembly factor TamB
MLRPIRRILFGSLLAFIVVLALLFNTSFGIQQLVNAVSWSLRQQHINLQVEGLSGNILNLQCRELKLQAEDYTITADQVKLKWQPWLLWHKQVKINSLVAQTVSIDYHSQTASQTPVSLQLPVTIDLANLAVKQVKLQGQAFGSLTASLQLHQATLNILQANLHQANRQLLLQGQVQLQDPYPINATVHWQLGQKIHGQTSLSGQWNKYLINSYSVIGDLQHPTGYLTFNALLNDQQLRSTELSGTLLQGKLQGDFSLNLASLAWQLQLTAQSIPLSSQYSMLPDINTAQITAQGNAQQAEVNSQLTSKVGKLSSQWQLSMEDGLAVNLQQFIWQSPYGNWQTTPVSFSYRQHQLSLPQFCFIHEKARLCVSGKGTDSNWQAQLFSENLSLSDLPIQALNWQPKANLQLEANIQKIAAEPVQAKLSLNLQALSLSPLTQNNSLSTAYPILQSAQFQLNLAEDELQAKLNAKLLENDYIKAHWQVSQVSQAANLHGQLEANISHLQLLDAFIVNTYHTQGQLNANLQFSGTLYEPLYQGDISLKQASTEIPALGINLTQIHILLTGNNQDQLQIQGSAHSGHGSIQLQGSANLWPKLTTTVSLNGQNFTLFDLPQAQLVVSPQLSFKQTTKQRQLSGSISVSSGQINADSWQQTSSQEQDVVIIRTAQQTPQTALPYNDKLQIMLGDQLYFSAYGLKTRLSGNLSIKSTSQRGTTATGVLQLNQGSYIAYGKNFTIQKGILNYAQSPLNDPNIDIVAIYELTPTGLSNNLERLEVGVHVQGSGLQPQISLFSSPPLSQEDILSYIVLGQPLSQTQSQTGNQAALSQAAMAFALSGGSKSVLQNIQQHLGLSQLTVGSINNNDPTAINAPTPSNSTTQTNTNDTAIFIGKQISPRIYVSYGVGIFSAEQIFKTQLQLTPHWSIWTDSSSQGSGADIVFTIEH